MRWTGAILGCVLAGGLAAGSAVAADHERLFAANCAVCHQIDGSGIVGLAPPLNDEKIGLDAATVAEARAANRDNASLEELRAGDAS